MGVSITRQQLREGAAQDAGLMLNLTGIGASDIDSTNNTVDLPQLFTRLPDSFHLADAFITENGSDFARIIKYHAESAPHKVQLDHIPTGLTGSSGGNAAAVYLLLSPEDWNNCINEALEELFKVVRVEIDLVAGQNEYDVDTQIDGETDTCTWLQSRTQVYGVECRKANGSSVSIEQWGGVRFLEDNNSLTVHLTFAPADSTATLILVGRKPYVYRGNTLDSDAATTNCPYKLAMLGTQVKAYRLLFKRHGEQMKRQFAAAIAVAEREYARAVNDFVPSMRPQPIMVDEAFVQDLPNEMIVWSW